MSLDTTYSVSILEKYDKSSSARYEAYLILADGQLPLTCGPLDGIEAGTKLSIRGTNTTPDGSCDMPGGQVAGFPKRINWREHGLTMGCGFGRYNIFVAVGELTSGACRGLHGVTLGRPDPAKNIFAPTPPGEIPNLLVGRCFYPDDPDAGESCQPCSDTWVAQLGK